MRGIRLGQTVRHVALGFDVRLVGWRQSRGLLLDWDGRGVLRWWCEPGDVAANENYGSTSIDWAAASNMYDVGGLRRLSRKNLATWLRAEKARLDELAEDTPEHLLQMDHLLEYAEWRGVMLLSEPAGMAANAGVSAPVAANDR